MAAVTNTVPNKLQSFLQRNTPLGRIQDLLIGSIRTGLVTGSGDLACQIMESQLAYNQGKEESKKNSYFGHLVSSDFQLDKRRLASIWAFGFFFFGPIGGAWYRELDHFVVRKLPSASKVKQVAAKVALEQALMGPVYTLAFFFFSQFAAEGGFHLGDFKDKLAQDYIKTLILDEGSWLIASPVLYGFIPVKHQLLVASFLSAGEAAGFSYIAFNSVDSVPIVGPILKELLSGHGGGSHANPEKPVDVTGV